MGIETATSMEIASTGHQISQQIVVEKPNRRKVKLELEANSQAVWETFARKSRPSIADSPDKRRFASMELKSESKCTLFTIRRIDIIILS